MASDWTPQVQSSSLIALLMTLDSVLCVARRSCPISPNLTESHRISPNLTESHRISQLPNLTVVTFRRYLAWHDRWKAGVTDMLPRLLLAHKVLCGVILLVPDDP